MDEMRKAGKDLTNSRAGKEAKHKGNISKEKSRKSGYSNYKNRFRSNYESSGNHFLDKRYRRQKPDYYKKPPHKKGNKQ